MKEVSSNYGWYEKILAKPEAYRKRLALLLTILLGIIIVTIWLFITAYQIQSVFKEKTSAPDDSSPIENTSPTTEENSLQLEKNNEIFNNSIPSD